MRLSHFQDAFSAALFQGDIDHSARSPSEVQALPALQAQPGFAVYRNTVLKACIDALQANYPTVNQLVGDHGFARQRRCMRGRLHPKMACSWTMGHRSRSFWRNLHRPPNCPICPLWRALIAAGQNAT